MIRRRIGILISGRGSNMAALIAAAADPDYPAEIALVISNVPEAAGIELARRAGVPAIAVAHRPFERDRAAHEAAIDHELREAGVELVCLAGYLRLLSPFLVDAWAGRMLNIHPSLLPAFPGLDTHARARQAGVKLHGCTVHLVSEIMDGGPILGQAAIAVLPDDTDASLAARVLAQEHLLYPLVVRLFATGQVGVTDSAAALVNPLPPPAAAP